MTAMQKTAFSAVANQPDQDVPCSFEQWWDNLEPGCGRQEDEMIRTFAAQAWMAALKTVRSETMPNGHARIDSRCDNACSFGHPCEGCVDAVRF